MESSTTSKRKQELPTNNENPRRKRRREGGCSSENKVQEILYVDSDSELSEGRDCVLVSEIVRKTTDKCENPNCTSITAIKFMEASSSIRNYYKLPYRKGRNWQICEVCYWKAERHNEKMANKFLKHESIIATRFPFYDAMVLVEDDDTPEEPLDDSVTEFLSNCGTDVINSLFEKYDINFQVEEGMKLLLERCDKSESDVASSLENFKQTETSFHATINDFYKQSECSKQELTPIEIDDGPEEILVDDDTGEGCEVILINSVRSLRNTTGSSDEVIEIADDLSKPDESCEVTVIEQIPEAHNEGSTLKPAEVNTSDEQQQLQKQPQSTLLLNSKVPLPQNIGVYHKPQSENGKLPVQMSSVQALQNSNTEIVSNTSQEQRKMTSVELSGQSGTIRNMGVQIPAQSRNELIKSMPKAQLLISALQKPQSTHQDSTKQLPTASQLKSIQNNTESTLHAAEQKAEKALDQPEQLKLQKPQNPSEQKYGTGYNLPKIMYQQTNHKVARSLQVVGNQPQQTHQQSNVHYVSTVSQQLGGPARPAILQHCSAQTAPNFSNQSVLKTVLNQPPKASQNFSVQQPSLESVLSCQQQPSRQSVLQSILQQTKQELINGTIQNTNSSNVASTVQASSEMNSMKSLVQVPTTVSSLYSGHLNSVTSDILQNNGSTVHQSAQRPGVQNQQLTENQNNTCITNLSNQIATSRSVTSYKPVDPSTPQSQYSPSNVEHKFFVRAVNIPQQKIHGQTMLTDMNQCPPQNIGQVAFHIGQSSSLLPTVPSCLPFTRDTVQHSNLQNVPTNQQQFSQNVSTNTQATYCRTVSSNISVQNSVSKFSNESNVIKTSQISDPKHTSMIFQLNNGQHPPSTTTQSPQATVITSVPHLIQQTGRQVTPTNFQNTKTSKVISKCAQQNLLENPTLKSLNVGRNTGAICVGNIPYVGNGCHENNVKNLHNAQVPNLPLKQTEKLSDDQHVPNLPQQQSAAMPKAVVPTSAHNIPTRREQPSSINPQTIASTNPDGNTYRQIVVTSQAHNSSCLPQFTNQSPQQANTENSVHFKRQQNNLSVPQHNSKQFKSNPSQALSCQPVIQFVEQHVKQHMAQALPASVTQKERTSSNSTVPLQSTTNPTPLHPRTTQISQTGTREAPQSQNKSAPLQNNHSEHVPVSNKLQGMNSNHISKAVTENEDSSTQKSKGHNADPLTLNREATEVGLQQYLHYKQQQQQKKGLAILDIEKNKSKVEPLSHFAKSELTSQLKTVPNSFHHNSVLSQLTQAHSQQPPTPKQPPPQQPPLATKPMLQQPSTLTNKITKQPAASAKITQQQLSAPMKLTLQHSTASTMLTPQQAPAPTMLAQQQRSAPSKINQQQSSAPTKLTQQSSAPTQLTQQHTLIPTQTTSQHPPMLTNPIPHQSAIPTKPTTKEPPIPTKPITQHIPVSMKPTLQQPPALTKPAPQSSSVTTKPTSQQAPMATNSTPWQISTPANPTLQQTSIPTQPMPQQPLIPTQLGLPQTPTPTQPSPHQLPTVTQPSPHQPPSASQASPQRPPMGTQPSTQVPEGSSELQQLQNPSMCQLPEDLVGMLQQQQQLVTMTSLVCDVLTRFLPSAFMQNCRKELTNNTSTPEASLLSINTKLSKGQDLGDKGNHEIIRPSYPGPSVIPKEEKMCLSPTSITPVSTPNKACLLTSPSSLSSTDSEISILTPSKESSESGLQDVVPVAKVPIRESNLPPLGPINRCPVLLGDPVYVMNDRNQPWSLGVVKDLKSQSNQTLYTVELTNSKNMKERRKVAGFQMAYTELQDYRFSVGHRVISVFRDETSDNKFCAGVIAEPPKTINRSRYLVFFDNGSSQYVKHEDIRLVVESSPNVWEDVHIEIRQFVQTYLEKYPERALLKVQEGQDVKTEWNGKWYNAKVIEVDASLALISFPSNIKHVEWIYRGSDRFHPLYLAHNKTCKEQFARSKAFARKAGDPYIQYTIKEEEDVDKEVPEGDSVSDTEEQGPTHRTIARKSTGSPLAAQHSRGPASAKVVKRLFYPCANREVYKVHKCKPICYVIHKPETYETSYRNHLSHLALPMLHGWTREKVKHSDYLSVYYRAPCKRRLRNIEELHKYLMITGSNLTIDHFEFDHWVRCFTEGTNENYFVKIEDISNGVEAVPVSCINTIDSRKPCEITYTTKRIPSEGTHIETDPEFLVGCDCTDDCLDKSKCACWKQTLDGIKYEEGDEPPEHEGYHYKRLNEPLVTGIYECNSRCKCSETCLNRVVQLPMKCKIQVFMTPNRGWGIRALHDIPKGNFICLYTGYVFPEKIGDDLAKKIGDEYQADLDYIESAEKVKEDYEESAYQSELEEEISKKQSSKHKGSTGNGRKQGSNQFKIVPSTRTLYGKNQRYILDARSCGNVGRFINHSCNANMFVQNVFVDTHDLRFPWVAFFTNSFVPANTELTWNYGYDVDSVPERMIICRCGEKNCQGRLL